MPPFEPPHGTDYQQLAQFFEAMAALNRAAEFLASDQPGTADLTVHLTPVRLDGVSAIEIRLLPEQPPIKVVKVPPLAKLWIPGVGAWLGQSKPITAALRLSRE